MCDLVHSTEAEYVVLRQWVKEALFTAAVLFYASAELSEPCIRTFVNPLSSDISKRMDVCFLFVRELLSSNKIYLVYIVCRFGGGARGHLDESLAAVHFV